jgi:hypothetical protein
MLIATVNSEVKSYSSAVATAQFVWFAILPGRPDAEFEEQMQRLAAECVIETINAQLGESTRHQRQVFTSTRWRIELASCPAI